MSKNYVADKDYRVPGGCGVSGIMNEAGKRFNGQAIISSIALMRDRSNGLGGGFAAYGIYPEMADYYAFHLMFESEEAKSETEEYLQKYYKIMYNDRIPNKTGGVIKYNPIARHKAGRRALVKKKM